MEYIRYIRKYIVSYFGNGLTSIAYTLIEGLHIFANNFVLIITTILSIN